MKNREANLEAVLRKVIGETHVAANEARTLETTVLECHPDADEDARFDHLLHILASYEPEGGEFLFDQKALVDECVRVLEILDRSPKRSELGFNERPSS